MEKKINPKKLERFDRWLSSLAESYDIDSEEFKILEKICKEFEKRFGKYYDIWKPIK